MNNDVTSYVGKDDLALSGNIPPCKPFFQAATQIGIIIYVIVY